MNTIGYQRPATIQRALIDEVRRWIHSGRLQPGEKVLQEDLAATFGTSVIPIREALKTLQSQGLLVHHPNRGFFVTELSSADLIELCSIRSVLESLAVEKALDSLDNDAITRMDDLIIAMEAADRDEQIEELIRLDRAFHFTLFSASESPQLLRIIEMTWDQSDAYRSAYFIDPANRASTHREHRQILEATRLRDSASVGELLDIHRLTPVQSLSMPPTAQPG